MGNKKILRIGNGDYRACHAYIALRDIENEVDRTNVMREGEFIRHKLEERKARRPYIRSDRITLTAYSLRLCNHEDQSGQRKAFIRNKPYGHIKTRSCKCSCHRFH